MCTCSGNSLSSSLERARDKLSSGSLIQFVQTVAYVLHVRKTKTTSRIHNSSRRKIIIKGSGLDSVNQEYKEQWGTDIPQSFVTWCELTRAPAHKKWAQLADRSKPWFEASNGCYMYFHTAFQQWWIDTKDGPVYWSESCCGGMPPVQTDSWATVSDHFQPVPRLEVFQG